MNWHPPKQLTSIAFTIRWWLRYWEGKRLRSKHFSNYNKLKNWIINEMPEGTYIEWIRSYPQKRRVPLIYEHEDPRKKRKEIPSG